MQRVFVATLGMAPAVVTETLWALKARATPWVPNVIEIVTTVGGAKALCERLLRPQGPLTSLYPAPDQCPPLRVFVPIRDSSSARIRSVGLTWSAETGQIVSDEDLSQGLADVDDAISADCMGDLILDRVHAATRQPGNQLHLSISGGRKTMSAHALFSLGLVGNPQDEASHVLMGPEFDSNPQFFHPDQGGLINTAGEQRLHREGKLPALPPPTLDPRDAARELKLFAIAAPRYDAIPKGLRDKGSLPRLSTIIDQMNLAGDWLRAPQMVLDADSNTATIAGRARVLDPVDFVWLRLLAVAASEAWACPQDGPGHAPGAVTVARLIFGAPGHGHLHRLRGWFDAAALAGLRGDKFARNAASRPDTSDAGESALATVKRLIAELDQSARRHGSARQDDIVNVADDLVQEIASFTKLSTHLAGHFGLPLAQALLPRRANRPRKVHGLSQAAYTLHGAVPGFLSCLGAEG